ncbi:hypothetical protein PAXINDRAFT_86129 [Paxillus involutus ATCC 200175]|uniref:DUF6830 domain-containing protein n=1 Tax=Paxillus involutus ATCC 200175 TaxID=664439 RepID=A0A0C9TRF7_PAXIN|nr:hypothetical protein PAXINDRAFT_86129 [Paxillus involutus ATCC 200175]
MPNCPQCLKHFPTAKGVTFHLQQPLTACHRWDRERIEVFPDANNPVTRSPPPSPEPMDLEVGPAGFTDSPGPVGEPGEDLMPVDLDSDSEQLQSQPPSPSQPSISLLSRQAKHIILFQGAAEIYSTGETFLLCFDLDQYSYHRQKNLYYPFAHMDDWQMANYLLTSGLSMRTIDEFLALGLVKKMPLSFWTAKELRGCAEMLPSGPRWNFQIVPMYGHQTRSQVHLYSRDTIDCIESLMNHPFFAGKIDFSPYHVYTTAEHLVREYSEWMTSDGAWDMQSKLPNGATLCGVILSSDKTHITNMCGGKVAHPLLISLANIKMSVRNKASSHAFLLLALMPIPNFIHPVSRMRSVLEAHLFHQCLDLDLEPLKQAARIGRMMSDPLGNLWHCYTPLASYIVDTPEACMLASCKQFRLSGVSDPFWHDWSLCDPSQFLTPEALHHWHRAFWDHDVRWCKQALGAQELDFRFAVLQPITGLRHFKEGITNLKQVSGWTQRDIQCYIIVVIAGAADSDVVIAIRALMDFRYLSQATVVTAEGRDRIANVLKTFHDHKQSIINSGLRQGTKGGILEHWQIPKLELMQSVAPSISQTGSLLQWSADTTEHAHIEVVKDPASTTNNHDYNSQICQCLDHLEKCRQFATAVGLREIADHVHESVAVDSNDMIPEDNGNKDPGDDSEQTTDVLNDLWAPKRAPLDFFAIAKKLGMAVPGSVPLPLCTFMGGSTAIHINHDPSISRISVDTAAEKFDLPDLHGALSDYLTREGPNAQHIHLFGAQRRSPPDAYLPFSDLQVWYKVHIQQRAYHNPSILAST